MFIMQTFTTLFQAHLPCYTLAWLSSVIKPFVYVGCSPPLYILHTDPENAVAGINIFLQNTKSADISPPHAKMWKIYSFVVLHTDRHLWVLLIKFSVHRGVGRARFRDGHSGHGSSQEGADVNNRTQHTYNGISIHPYPSLPDIVLCCSV